MALGLYLVAAAWGVFLQWGPRVGDEAWTWLMARDLPRAFVDVHPLLPSVLLHPVSQIPEWGPQAVGLTTALLAALAVPLATLTYGPQAGLLVLLSPGLALAMGFSRTLSLVLPLLFLLLYALKRGRDTLAALSATLLFLTHFQGQVAAAAAFFLMGREARKEFLILALTNPFFWLELARGVALAQGALTGEGVGSPVNQAPLFAENLLGPLPLGLVTALLAARSAWKGAREALLPAALYCALTAVKRIGPLYAGPAGAVTAVVAFLGLPEEKRWKRPAFLLLAAALAAGSLQVGVWVREARTVMAARALEPGPLAVAYRTSDPLALRLAGYRGEFLCPPTRSGAQ